MVDLVISGIDLPPYSIRGVTQNLEPIEAAVQMARSINGKLVDMSAPEFKKYRTSLSCSDFQPPDSAMPGTLVVVDCAEELSFRTVGGTQQRPEVPGSVRTEGAFVFYRPRLTMRVQGFSSDFNEAEATVSWTMVLEED